MLTRSIAIHRPHILTAGTGLYPASTSGPTISPFSVKLKLRRYHHVTPVSNRTPVKRITSALVQGYGKAATATAILPTAIGWGCRFFGSDNNHGHGHQSPSPVPSICESDLQCTRNTRFPIIYHTNFLTENGMIKSPMGVIGPAHTYNKLKRYKAERGMERAEEERDELWGWNVLDKDPEDRDTEMERERMNNRMREAEAFIAGVVAEAEAAGVLMENG
ncbi:hypothetical protein FPQ18DRAFT_387762 [Pyronema domesticum]|nr:hypothetical protein FPQ18DRAFT_387762 [Pyronema domesticum]